MDSLRKSSIMGTANVVTPCVSMNDDIVYLTNWGRATHICVSKLTIIASDNCLSPGRRQAIIWNNVGILSIGLLGTNVSEIIIAILTFSFKKMRFKVSSVKWRSFCLGLNVLTREGFCTFCAFPLCHSPLASCYPYTTLVSSALWESPFFSIIGISMTQFDIFHMFFALFILQLPSIILFVATQRELKDSEWLP